MQDNNFNSAEHYSLNNDESYLFNSILQPVPLESQSNPSPTEPMYQESLPSYVGQENMTQHMIDSNALQSATAVVNICSAEPVQQQSDIQQQCAPIPDSARSSNPQRRRGRRRRNTDAEKSFSEAVEELLGPFEDEDSRISRQVPEFDYFPGYFSFNVSLPTEQDGPDGVSMAYSQIRNKLYVKKDHSFNVTFFTSSSVPSGTKIKAMGMFIQREYATYIVKRCNKHVFADYNKGIEAPDHVIRCDSDQVVYNKDRTSGRRNLVIPYENPLKSQYCPSYLIYPFKFVCSGGCIGGLNGRPFRIIFTLEIGDTVMGRRSIEVKICEDPHKEMSADNKKIPQPQDPEPKTGEIADRKRKYHLVDDSIEKTTSEEESSGGGPFKLKVPDREMYEFLMLARQHYKLAKNLEKLSPYIMQYLANYQKKKKKKE